MYIELRYYLINNIFTMIKNKLLCVYLKGKNNNITFYTIIIL